MQFFSVFLFFLYIIGGMSEFHNIQTITYDDENIDSVMAENKFVKIGKKYYNVRVDMQVNWFEAAHICRTYNAHLATIENAAEMDALNKYLTNLYTQGFFWTSGNCLRAPGSYSWLSTGKPITYTNWSKGQPDKRAGDENCIHLWIMDGKFQWNDNFCSNLAHFICEANPAGAIKFVVF